MKYTENETKVTRKMVAIHEKYDNAWKGESTIFQSELLLQNWNNRWC